MHDRPARSARALHVFRQGAMPARDATSPGMLATRPRRTPASATPKKSNDRSVLPAGRSACSSPAGAVGNNSDLRDAVHCLPWSQGTITSTPTNPSARTLPVVIRSGHRCPSGFRTNSTGGAGWSRWHDARDDLPAHTPQHEGSPSECGEPCPAQRAAPCSARWPDCSPRLVADIYWSPPGTLVRGHADLITR